MEPNSSGITHPPETLTTPRLCLSRFRPGDDADHHAAALASKPELSAWFPWAQSLDAENRYQEFINNQRQLWDEGHEFNYMMRRPGHPESLGSVGFILADSSQRRYEIGYWLATAHWGCGYMTEAVTAITEMAFARLNARRVYLRCRTDNHRSMAVARRCGFQHEGIIRSDLLHPPDTFFDLAYFSMIDPERPTRNPLQ